MTSESAFNLGDLNNIIDISNSPFLKNLPLNFIFSIFYDYNKGDKCLLCYEKSFNLFKHLESVSKIQGNTAEIGVYTGVTSKLIHMFTPDKKHYCYDTYCGIKGSDSNIDLHKDGDFSCGLDDVKKNIGSADNGNIIYKVGYFPDTFDESTERFSFVHSDTDTYNGTLNTIKYFKDIMLPGGKIIFDDYCWVNCPGVEKALHEFREYDTDFIHEPMKHYNQYILIKKQNNNSLNKYINKIFQNFEYGELLSEYYSFMSYIMSQINKDDVYSAAIKVNKYPILYKHKEQFKNMLLETLPNFKVSIDNDNLNNDDCHVVVDWKDFKSTLLLNNNNMGKVFTNIYEKKIWGDNQNIDYNGSSGEGSDINYNKDSYVPFLKTFILGNDIKNIVDLGCGDFKCGKLIYDDLDVLYNGYDAYKKVIDYNSSINDLPKYSFTHLDFCNNKEIIVNGDLCILKDVIQHWSLDNIYSFLDYLVEYKKFKYILICNCCNQTQDNTNITDGDFRPLSCEYFPLKKYNPIKLMNYGSKEVCLIKIK
jgi:hypothetical protein